MDQLLTYQFQEIFPGCRLLDIHEYLMKKGVSMLVKDGVGYLYNDPCHSPIKHYNPMEVASKLLGGNVALSDRCCGEAGTFAVSRPDIATQVRFRKQQELQKGIGGLEADGGAPGSQSKLLTTCPACLQGLSRYRDEVPVAADYIVTQLAANRLGEGWRESFLDRVHQGGIEWVLL